MHKTLLPILSIVALAFAGCATGVNIATISTPAQVQADITTVGGLVVTKISTTAKNDIHMFAETLLSASASNLNATTIQSWIPKVPAADQALVGVTVNGGLVSLM